ncbi:MAG TPA: tripartite tricarboxylate transporter substrate binding protein, partial [Burkholderiales bacterium]|nr:tripartite tricarboxylate transporter substrate binding protein [Burkholderiales bacterium]
GASPRRSIDTGGVLLKAAVATLLAAAFSASALVHAQGYPERPLRFVIPFPPGGGADNLARIVGVAASEKLGQQIVIDNRAGAGGNIAAEVVAKAAPDGYTLLQTNVAHAISTSLYRKLNYDLVQDFAPVTQLASIPFVLAVNPGTGFTSIKDLIARAKAKPGELAYASSGSGGPSHLAMELFKSMAGVEIRHIPYKGAVPGATDLMAGQVQMMFFTVSAALPLMNSGRLKCLAIASTRRSLLAPDIPTVSEAGLPGFEATTWFGVMAPRGIAPNSVGKLHAAFTAALKQPDVRDRVLKQGFDIAGSNPAEFAAYVKAEIPKWAKVVKASGASVD